MITPTNACLHPYMVFCSCCKPSHSPSTDKQYRQLTEHEMNDIHFWLRKFELDQDLPSVCQTYARVVRCTDYDMTSSIAPARFAVAQ